MYLNTPFTIIYYLILYLITNTIIVCFFYSLLLVFMCESSPVTHRLSAYSLHPNHQNSLNSNTYFTKDCYLSYTYYY